MPPIITYNWFAIFVSIVLAFVFGGLWYGPIMGKPWMIAMGMKPEECQKPDPKEMKQSFIYQLIGTALTVMVASYFVQLVRPSVWSMAAMDSSSYIYGLKTGFFIWLGFYIPLQLGKVSWEKRPLKLFYINAAHDFINLQIICQILANWRGQV